MPANGGYADLAVVITPLQTQHPDIHRQLFIDQHYQSEQVDTPNVELEDVENE